MTRDHYSELPDILQSISDKPSSHTLICSGATRDWPSGRGVFHNNQATLFAWTNREDHLRIMYRDRKMDFVESFRTYVIFRSSQGEVFLEIVFFFSIVRSFTSIIIQEK